MAQQAIKREPISGSQMSSYAPYSASRESASAAMESSAPPSGSHFIKPDIDQYRRSHAPSLGTTQGPGFPDDECVFLEVRPKSLATATYQVATRPKDAEPFYQGTFKDIARKLKSYHDTLGVLQGLGISHDVHLPELVLVGDQSAGKSSLMSSLADLSLPQSESTCTRCPTHIRLSRSNEFSCRVSLQQDWQYLEPEYPIRSEAVTANNPFPPWVPQSRQVKEFKTIYAKEELEEVLKWAQIAVLNHTHPFEMYIPGSGEVAQTMDIDTVRLDAKFSPNIVALEIRGPEMPDLSFYDLPGLFLSPAQEEDRYLVKVVDNLARKFLRNDRAIVMWAVPMNADPDTSKTLAIVRELHAQRRTIGVMTKADLLPEGSLNQWLRILNGDSHVLGEGYFITSRGPTDMAGDRQKEWESDLFGGNNEKWPASFHNFQDRCGVERLKAFLVQKLGEMFGESLPMIKKKVLDKILHVDQQLALLPELPANTELEIRQSLLLFTRNVRSTLEGYDFSARWTELSGNFRDCILAMKPKFNLRSPVGHGPGEVITLESDDDSRSVNGRGTANGKRRAPAEMAPPPTPSKRSRGPAHPPSTNGFTNGASTEPRQPQYATRVRLAKPFQAFEATGRAFRSLGDVRNEIRRKARPGMSGIVSNEVYNDLCTEAVRDWHRPLNTLLETAIKDVTDVFDASLRVAFVNLQKREVFKAASRHIDEFLRLHGAETYKVLETIYQLETRQLFCLNTEALSQYRDQELGQLRHARHHLRWNEFSGETAPYVPWERLDDTSRAAEMRRMDNESKSLGGPDPFEHEIGVAAYVRGYYLTAAHRFVEHSCMALVSGLVPQIKDQLDGYLDAKLGLLTARGPDVFDSLMSEDAGTALLRSDLKRDKERFEKALDSIRLLEEQTAAPGRQPNAERNMISNSFGNGRILGTDIDSGSIVESAAYVNRSMSATSSSSDYIH